MRFFPDSSIPSTLHTGLHSQVAVKRRTNARSTEQCFFINRGEVDRELFSWDISRKPRASEPSAKDSVLRRNITTYSYLDISIFRFMNQNLSPIFSISRVARTGSHCRRLPTPATSGVPRNFFRGGWGGGSTNSV